MPAGLVTRREALTAGAAALLTPWAARAHRTGSDRRPNIIFVMADDLGYGDLGCYGQQRIRTPHLDAMAAAGTRFTDVYAGSTVCAPSRCCLMTGYHTGHARIRGNARVPLEPGDVTVAEVLQAAGYHTSLVGKWGLGDTGTTGHPNRQGFDEFFGYTDQRHAHNYWPSFLWRNEEKVPLRNVVPNEDAVGAGVATTRLDYSHDLFMHEALEFIDRRRANPFFLYLALTIPHANNEAKAAGMEVPTDKPYHDEPWPAAQRQHAAMITRLDRDLGRLFTKLRRLGIADDTLVVFTSDNGPHREGGNNPDFNHSSGVLRGIKRDLYEGGIRVPTIAYWPQHVPAGRVSHQPWAFWDVLPTLADFAGVKAPQGLDGISVADQWLGAPMVAHPPLYWEFHERGFSQAVREGRWKAVRAGGPSKPAELYDLIDDPQESRDLSRAEADIARGLERIMEASRTDNPHWMPKV